MTSAKQRLGSKDGVKQQWRRHELAQGKAAARRRRQMAAGQVGQVFCPQHPKNPATSTGLCSECLQRKFG